MTPLSVAERAEQVVDHAFDMVVKQTVPKPPHQGWMAFCDAVRNQLYLEVASALTTHAEAAVKEAKRQTWEEAAKLRCPMCRVGDALNPTTMVHETSPMAWNQCQAPEFRRRAQEGAS